MIYGMSFDWEWYFLYSDGSVSGARDSLHEALESISETSQYSDRTTYFEYACKINHKSMNDPTTHFFNSNDNPEFFL